MGNVFFPKTKGESLMTPDVPKIQAAIEELKAAGVCSRGQDVIKKLVEGLGVEFPKPAPAPKFYSTGDRFTMCGGTELMLAGFKRGYSENHVAVALIKVGPGNDADTGWVYHWAEDVEDRTAITEAEFAKICGGHPKYFTPVS
jgi:hypothetical protein